LLDDNCCSRYEIEDAVEQALRNAALWDEVHDILGHFG